MKYIISLMVAVLVTISSFAQIDSIKLSADSSIMVDKLYLGMLSSTAFSTKSLSTSSSVNFRVGAMVSWKLSKKVGIYSFGMIQTDLNQTSGIHQFYMVFKPSKHWGFAAGQMATVSTELRAHPVSAGGQFETWTQAKIPGGAPGIKLKYVGKMSVGISVASRNGGPEYHGSLSKGRHTIAGYYRKSGNQSGLAYNYKSTKFYSLWVFIPNSLLATTAVVNLKSNYSLFADLGYGSTTKSLVRGEVGVFKSFSSKWIKGLLSVSYDLKTRSFNGYLFVHL